MIEKYMKFLNDVRCGYTVFNKMMDIIVYA